MITPPYLKTGDTVAIISTARKVNRTYIDEAIKLFKSRGLNVITGDHLYDDENQFAGSDEHRRHDLQAALDRQEIKAIFCARGGYGTVRIIDGINFEKMKSLPKWIVGYSDVTVLHCHLQKQLGVESLHASMPVNFASNSERSLQLMVDSLFGQKLEYQFDKHPLNRNGKSEGEVIGGNLSILYSLNGSSTFPDTKGKILFLEDLDEYLYHIDRMMMNLKRSGALDHLAGLVIGGLSKMHDNEVPFGKSAEEIIAGAVSEFDYPLCFNFPAGHIDDNCPLIFGRMASLEVSGSNTSLTFLS